MNGGHSRVQEEGASTPDRVHDLTTLLMSDDTPPAERPSLFKTSVSFGGFCEVIAFLALTGTWLGSSGRLHWALDLFSHFRLQYLVCFGGRGGLCLLRRRTWLVLVALMSLLWNAQIVYTVHQTAAPNPASSAKPLRVMTFNIMTSNENHVACIDHVLKATPTSSACWRSMNPGG
jgi:hypothetical protein